MKKSSGFEKFINPQSNAKKREAFRQEKRDAKKDMKAYGDELRSEKSAKSRGEKTFEPEKGKRHNPAHGRQGDSFRKRQSPRHHDDPEDLANRFDKPKRENSPENKSSYSRRNDTGKPVQKGKFAEQRSYEKSYKKKEFKEEEVAEEKMPLNKYIAHSGVCSRREAAELVKKGLVKVNKDIVYEPGLKIADNDIVYVGDKKITLQERLVYVIMNKPKDHITTVEDEKGRKTVLDLVKNHVEERIYPVGRLDRNTTGVLLLTNDGELAQKLTHPSFEVKKIYEVTLDKVLTKEDATKILEGIHLEDGFIKADALGYADAKDKKVVGIEIHSGKNHIVKRIFMHFGYSVTKLDRVMFANLTKKNVERGKWRFLNEKEIRLLKSMNRGGRYSGNRNKKSE